MLKNIYIYLKVLLKNTVVYVIEILWVKDKWVFFFIFVVIIFFYFLCLSDSLLV